ncbi:MAG: rRNA maturation RNase YbeY [Solirubrobacterales bacterium]|nr:rRNA maturation RNase YbeY [Solirubrobacterales bacterium]
MIDVEVLGLESVDEAPSATEVRDLCVWSAASRGVSDGHVAVAFVDPSRIAELNCEHRAKAGPTDVLSFPIDGLAAGAAGAAGLGVPCELGDIVICAEHTVDLREAVVHGMLHLLGMDHETDRGEMLALQARLLTGDR